MLLLYGGESVLIGLEHNSDHGLSFNRSRFVLRPDWFGSIIINGDQSTVTPSAVRIEIVSNFGRSHRRLLGLDRKRTYSLDIIDGGGNRNVSSLDGYDCGRDNIIFIISVKRLDLQDIIIIHAPVDILFCRTFWQDSGI